MKHLSKMLKGLVAVFAAAAMALTLAPTAFAAEATHTITINEPSGQTVTHTYEAYQVFSGNYDSTSKQLQNIKWGSGVNGESLLKALKADTTLKSVFADATDAPTAAAAMSNLNAEQTAAMAKVVANNLAETKATSTAGKVTVTGDGYYFLKDVTEQDKIGSDTYSKYILQVVGDETITPKDTTTTSEKFVKDTNDSKANSTTDWRKVADYDMGDDVPFELVGTIASDYADYKTYEFSFVDSYSKQQFGDPEHVVVKVDGKIVSQDELTAAGYKLDKNDAGFTISFTDLKQISEVSAGSKVSVEYTAKLLTTANVGSTGNVNKSHITFSNDSNQTGHKGKTPDDTVIVFTYKVVVNKQNEAGKDLDGAGFTLYKKNANGEYQKVGNELKSGHKFSFVGLDDGDYRLEETTVPTGYNKMSNIDFSVVSVKDNTGKSLTSINGIASTGEIDFGTQKASVDKNAGSISATVVNKSGSTLPSTGGMGTTVLYVAGAAIVVAAGIGLAIRRNKRQDA